MEDFDLLEVLENVTGQLARDEITQLQALFILNNIVHYKED